MNICEYDFILTFLFILHIYMMPFFSEGFAMSTALSRRRAPEGSAERLLQARLPAALVKELRILALEEDTTVKELLTRLVQEYVGRRRKVSGRRS
jgi:hypothetical protein